ncbi:MAG: ATP-dependent Clp protease ATP-binding subunit ClpA, partial [Gammaproteobacteria bacterium]|nr:ATP-dependent Clp protease ATP-binding subunit ClpA [Gammaproteobacteria bacterium]
THQDHSADAMEIIKKLFTPEFRNRLDSIVQFNALDPAVMIQVVDKFIFELEAQFQAQQVTIEVDEAARLWLAEHGHDEKMGARPMARLIQQHIKKPMAEELLFGRLAHGGHLIVHLEEDELAFEIQEKETAH